MSAGVVIVVIVGVLGACTFEAGGVVDARDPDAPGTWLTGYAYRKPLTIRTGAPGTLDDFVVAIVLPSDAALAGQAQDDATDLAFTSADEATILDFEIERFDGGSGALAAWVRFGALAPSTSANLYYGATSASLQDVAGTWPASTFKGVWHLTDPQPALARDSTAAAHTLASPSDTRTPVTSEPALVGAGRRYEAASIQTLRVGDDDHFDGGLLGFSYGVWVKVTSSAGSYDMPMFKGGSSSDAPGYDIELGTGGWTSYVGDGTTNLGVSYGSETTYIGSWVHLVAVVDRQAQLLRAYANGVQQNTGTLIGIGPIDSPFDLNIGTDDGSNYPFKGELDEPRVYARALTPEWIAAEYANLSSPGTFVVLGAEQMRP